jgi:hypothetical protein
VRGESDDRPTLARYTLRDSVEARAFVKLLIDALSAEAGTGGRDYEGSSRRRIREASPLNGVFVTRGP